MKFNINGLIWLLFTCEYFVNPNQLKCNVWSWLCSVIIKISYVLISDNVFNTCVSKLTFNEMKDLLFDLITEGATTNIFSTIVCKKDWFILILRVGFIDVKIFNFSVLATFCNSLISKIKNPSNLTGSSLILLSFVVSSFVEIIWSHTHDKTIFCFFSINPFKSWGYILWTSFGFCLLIK